MATALFCRSSRSTVIAVLAGGVLLLAGCTTGSGTASSENAAQASVAVAGDAPNARDGAGIGASSEEVGGAPSAPDDVPQPAGDLAVVPTAGSKVIRTADLAVRLAVAPVSNTGDQTGDPDSDSAARAVAASSAATSAREIASAAGGYQASSEGGGSQVTISLRVPTEQYESVLGKLSALGEVTRRTESSQDVTAQSVDVDSRVKSMTASVTRVRALLAEATTIGEVISIEAELSAREADLESIQQQKAALDGQVALSTIGLSVTAVTAADDSSPPVIADSGFLAGLEAGWSSLLGVLSFSGRAVGAVLPFLPFVLAFGAVLWWLSRRLAGRRSPADAADREELRPGDPPTTHGAETATGDLDPAETEPVAAGAR